MTPTLHRIPISNPGSQGTYTLAVYDWGNPESQRVAVCVHGLTRNARDFDFLASQLASRGRRVLAISMAGRGESDWLNDPMSYHYGTYVADCLRVMDNFHIRDVEWIGTSMGGIIGMMIAAGHPNRIQKLVLNDIGAILSKAALTRIYEYVRAMPTQFPSRAAAEAYIRQAFTPWGITDEAIWSHVIASSVIERAGQLRYACDPGIATPLAAGSKNFTEVNDVNLSPVWAEVKAPTLILRGANSDILSEETVSAMRAIHLDTESVSIPGVGHAPALMDHSQTDPLLAWLERSLAGIMAKSF